MRTREIIAAINALDRSIKKLEDLDAKIKKLPERLEEELKQVSKKAVYEWYDAYKDRADNGYDPMFSLEHAYKINVKVKNNYLRYSISFSPYYMRRFHHHQSNQIIYNNSFLRGYHGGSEGMHGELGSTIPYYREPAPYFTNWLRPAVRTTSPYDLIIEEVDKVEAKIQAEIDSSVAEIKNILAPHLNNMRR